MAWLESLHPPSFRVNNSLDNDNWLGRTSLVNMIHSVIAHIVPNRRHLVPLLALGMAAGAQALTVTSLSPQGEVS